MIQYDDRTKHTPDESKKVKRVNFITNEWTEIKNSQIQMCFACQFNRFEKICLTN